MIYLWGRRTASILAILLFLASVLFWGSYYFYPLLLGSVVVQFLVQRATEIGWRIFRSDLDERQDALKSRILDLSYRWLIVLVLLAMLLIPLVGLMIDSPHRYSFFLRHELFGSFGYFASGSLGILPPYVDLFVILLVVIFFLPGVIAAWIEPVPGRADKPVTADY